VHALVLAPIHHWIPAAVGKGDGPEPLLRAAMELDG
jgi:hypothetical protein